MSPEQAVEMYANANELTARKTAPDGSVLFLVTPEDGGHQFAVEAHRNAFTGQFEAGDEFTAEQFRSV